MTRPTSASDAFGQASRAEQMRRLAAVWRQALDPILHGSGCGCCSNPGIVLRADWLEEDILDYLQVRYRAAPDDPLIPLLREREGHRDTDFLTWISQLESRDVADADAARLRAGLFEVVSGMARSHGHTKMLG